MSVITPLCDATDFDDIISFYFNEGLSNKEINSFISEYHDINISLSTLKRHLKRLHLKKRIEEDDKVLFIYSLSFTSIYIKASHLHGLIKLDII